MDILAELFSSEALVKIIRLFFLNPEEIFDIREISHRSKVSVDHARRELRLLTKIVFIHETTKEVYFARSGRKRSQKKKIKGFRLNGNFPFLRSLKNLVLNAAPVSRQDLLRHLKKAGHLKLVVLSGIFLDVEETNGRIDMLIVGDNLKKSAIENTMRFLEAKIGKEINYAALTTAEFKYRLGMYDRFVRDVLDYAHDKILNKMDI